MSALRPAEDAQSGIRLVTLGDGAERGVRLLEVRSGGGLDCDIVVDRCFDIGRLALDAVTHSWHSPTGLRAPWLFDPFDDAGQGFQRGFSGCLATCGLDHIRQPEVEDGRAYPLHGRGAHEPSRLAGYGCRDGVIWAEGEVTQASAMGTALRLSRRIEIPVGGAALTVSDRVTNVGHVPTSQMLLYHINLGHPLASDGARIETGGGTPIWIDPDHEPLAPWRTGGARRELLSAHAVAEAASAALTAPEAGVRLDLTWDGAMLPCLQILRMEGPGLNGVAFEPCTTRWRSRAAARAAGEITMLAPGEARSYGFRLALSRLAADPATSTTQERGRACV